VKVAADQAGIDLGRIEVEETATERSSPRARAAGCRTWPWTASDHLKRPEVGCG
jgi:hypothetical protein